MFNDNINFLVQSIEKSVVIEKHGIYYQTFQNILPESLIKQLQKINPTNCVVTKLEKQKNLNRVRVDYKENISKELNLIFRSAKIKKVLEDKYKIKLQAETADIWFDSDGYNLLPHRDDSRIALALQIYLGSEQSMPGTVLYSSQNAKTPFTVFKYKENTGYALLNNAQSWHGTEHKLVGNAIRKSIYIRYARI